MSVALADEVRELLYKIRLGEDPSIEFKAVSFQGDEVDSPHRDSLAAEIAAFANAQGGDVMLGVENRTQQVVGIPLERLDVVETFVQGVLDRIEPQPMVSLRRLELPDQAGVQRPVLRIQIPRSLFVHRSPGGYYTRRGSEKREMSTEWLGRLIQQRSQARLIRFDEQPVPGSSLADADADLCQRFLGPNEARRPQVQPEAEWRRIVVAPRFRKLRLLADLDGEACLTVTGVLLCTRRPADFLPNAYIQCVAYRGRGRDGNEQLDARDCDGPVDEQVTEALQFVRRNMRVAAIKDPGRVDLPQYSLRAVFEALVNAVAHRDYSISGARVRLHLFADRLELNAPGALPNSLSIETLADLTATRNELLVNLLSRYFEADPVTGRQNLIEKRGEGVPTILRESERLSGRLPVYRTVGEAELGLTIYAAALPAVV